MSVNLISKFTEWSMCIKHVFKQIKFQMPEVHGLFKLIPCLPISKSDVKNVNIHIYNLWLKI